MTQYIKMDARETDYVLHYRACGLDDVYLVNGWSHEIVDGEEYLTVEDLDGLVANPQQVSANAIGKNSHRVRKGA